MLAQIFIEFIKKHPSYLVVNAILMLLVPINEIYLSSLYGKLFEAIQTNTFTTNHFHKILFVIGFLQIGYCFSDYFFANQTCTFQEHLKIKFVKDIFHRFDKCKEEPSVNDSMSRIIRTQHILSDWYTKIFAYLLPVVLQLVVTIVFFLKTDLLLGIYIGVVVVIFLSFILFGNNTCKKATRTMDNHLFDIHDVMSDIIENYITVHKAGTITGEINALQNKFKTYNTYHTNVVLCGIKYRVMLTVIIIIFVYLFVQRCHTILKEKRLQTAVFYSMFMILSNLIGNMIRMINVQRDMSFDLNLINNSGFSSCTANDFVDGKCHTMRKTTPNLEKKTVFELRDISYQYENSKVFTLKNLNLQVFDKEILLITGHIGSGKSTLIKLMTRLAYPTHGTILLRDRCIYDIPNKHYYKRVGFMPQNALLFKRSILENIKYNNPTLKTSQIDSVIKKYNLTIHFPNGLHVSSTSLSGGQRQLVWFLRIFFMKPDIIVMDEPTASIDTETKIVFMNIIKTMLNDKTIIIITHDQFLYPYGTRIVSMDDINHMK